MSALPLHYMQVIKISKGVIKHIDKLRRNFLWKGKDPCKGMNCLVNWNKVCALKSNGGLGIKDLAVQNDALLMKWLWKVTTQQCHWTNMVKLLYAITDPMQFSAGNYNSFCIRTLALLVPFYGCSLENREQEVGPKWRWTPGGSFTTSSAYARMHDRGVLCRIHNQLWKLKIPLKIKAFLWIALQNRILTQETLQIRGCSVTIGCVLCANTLLETRDHIFLTYNYSNKNLGSPANNLRSGSLLLYCYNYVGFVESNTNERPCNSGREHDMGNRDVSTMV